MIVVSDTSPITNLAAIGQLELLRQLYKKVVLPEAVYEELTIEPISAGGLEAKSCQWIEVQKVSTQSLQVATKYGLDAGETEAIALALDIKESKLLIDERAGRKAAEELNLSFTGVLGVLVAAKEEGLIAEIKPLLDALRDPVGFYVAENLYRQVLEEVQEI